LLILVKKNRRGLDQPSISPAQITGTHFALGTHMRKEKQQKTKGGDHERLYDRNAR
jgi:hypothetical protein